MVCKEGLDSVLVPAGFVADTRKLTWVRLSQDVRHLVTILHRRKFYDLQWGVNTDGAAEIIWGASTDPKDVGQAVLSGTPSGIRRPAPGQSWTLESGVDRSKVEEIAAAVRDDAAVVAKRLEDFPNRKAVRNYLLENRNPIDQRDFVIPANLPLKLLTAATLAVLDRDAQACQLLPEVESAMARYSDDLSTSRLTRLRTAVRPLCE